MARAVELYGPLRLPPVALQLRQGKSTSRPLDVYDPLRRKWVALAPEEWVRQHFAAFMVGSLGYSPLRMANEVTLTLNGTVRRADTVVYDDALRPLLLVEYKAPTVALTAETVRQVMRYNLVFKAAAAMVTNGIDVYGIVGTDIHRGVITASTLKAIGGE